MHSDEASTAFVASLLPARFLVDHAESLKVSRIVVLNRTHEQSYQYVAQRIPGVTVSRLHGGTLRAAISIATQLIITKARRRSVIFFHECCWPVFDLLVSLVRPAGSFFPQVTMAGFDMVNPAELPAPAGWRGWARSLALRLFVDRFVVYRAPKSSGEGGHDYFLSFRRYPASIRVVPAGKRADTVGVKPSQSTNGSGADRVIFIGGTEWAVADDYLRSVYRNLIDIAQSAGYAVFIKDHPIGRLNVQSDSCVSIDPAMPVELVDQSFAFAIGVASTGLLGIGDRKISIVKALDAMPDNVKLMRVNHLLSLPGGGSIEFVSSIEDVRRVLREGRIAS